MNTQWKLHCTLFVHKTISRWLQRARTCVSGFLHKNVLSLNFEGFLIAAKRNSIKVVHWTRRIAADNESDGRRLRDGEVRILLKSLNPTSTCFSILDEGSCWLSKKIIWVRDWINSFIVIRLLYLLFAVTSTWETEGWISSKTDRWWTTIRFTSNSWEDISKSSVAGVSLSLIVILGNCVTAKATPFNEAFEAFPFLSSLQPLRHPGDNPHIHSRRFPWRILHKR